MHSKSPAERHLLALQVLTMLMVGLHFMSIASVALNLAMAVSGTTPAPASESEALGYYGAFACIGTWALLGLLWAPLNAWGLHRRQRWARISTFAYCTLTSLTLCCMPFGAYGIYVLLRKDVVALLTPRD
jgi:hypothetical protein